MIESSRSYGGMVVAPHHLAAEAGLRILQDGGNAIEAMIAAASTIAVVYPHMNALGGDNFWLIYSPGGTPVGIDACGAAANLANIEFYNSKELSEIPGRGPLAALTVAGAVSGWQKALEFSKDKWDGSLTLDRLLEGAIRCARDGFAVTNTQALNTRSKLPELENQPGYSDLFLNDGKPPAAGDRFCQPELANTLARLGRDGLDSFYRGKLAQEIAVGLEKLNSPLRLADFEGHQAIKVEPLSLDIAGHKVFNLPPPTQGLASLMLLGIFERLKVNQADGFDYVHAIVESTKCAFRIRDAHISDPNYMDVSPSDFLIANCLDDLAGSIDRQKAAPWPYAKPGGDTVWLGAIDAKGRVVSFIQSIYWEFGSGIVLPELGICWQNRGTSFSLDPSHHNCLKPGRKPFHTIQPAFAMLNDGRTMAYGTMGGDGQPQTQAILFSRYALFGQELQEAISAPRWLLGKTWGSEVTNLRLEDRFETNLYEQLQAAGHDIEIIGKYDEIMGHAGALVYHPDGMIEGASDPRSDGDAAGI